jgi:hypothetical protein
MRHDCPTDCGPRCIHLHPHEPGCGWAPVTDPEAADAEAAGQAEELQRAARVIADTRTEDGTAVRTYPSPEAMAADQCTCCDACQERHPRHDPLAHEHDPDCQLGEYQVEYDDDDQFERAHADAVQQVAAEGLEPGFRPNLDTERAEDDRPRIDPRVLEALERLRTREEEERRVQAPGGPPPGRGYGGGYRWGGVGPGNSYARQADPQGRERPVTYELFRDWCRYHGVDLDGDVVMEIAFTPSGVHPGIPRVSMTVRKAARDLQGRVMANRDDGPVMVERHVPLVCLPGDHLEQDLVAAVAPGPSADPDPTSSTPTEDLERLIDRLRLHHINHQERRQAAQERRTDPPEGPPTPESVETPSEAPEIPPSPNWR